jgi:hypothetical protein
MTDEKKRLPKGITTGTSSAAAWEKWMEHHFQLSPRVTMLYADQCRANAAKFLAENGAESFVEAVDFAIGAGLRSLPARPRPRNDAPFAKKQPVLFVERPRTDEEWNS